MTAKGVCREYTGFIGYMLEEESYDEVKRN